MLCLSHLERLRLSTELRLLLYLTIRTNPHSRSHLCDLTGVRKLSLESTRLSATDATRRTTRLLSGERLERLRLRDLPRCGVRLRLCDGTRCLSGVRLRLRDGTRRLRDLRRTTLELHADTGLTRRGLRLRCGTLLVVGLVGKNCSLRTRCVTTTGLTTSDRLTRLQRGLRLEVYSCLTRCGVRLRLRGLPTLGLTVGAEPIFHASANGVEDRVVAGANILSAL